MSKTEQAKAALTTERAKLESLRALSIAADRSADAATPGGLHGYDPAVLSGMTRSKKAGEKSRDRRFAAYDKQAAASAALTEQERRVKVAEASLERAKRDAAAPCDLSSLVAGSFVRDRHGWHRVVRVSAKSVSVETPWSWTDRIPKERIIETRAPHAEAA